MWVVKLGGSFVRSPLLPDWTAALAEAGAGKVVVVPGGGPFADLVRTEQGRAGFPDATAHRMAILAMEQFGFMLEAMHERLRAAATEEELRRVLAQGDVPVWLAYPMVIREDTLPQDWTVTADSLALWLAIRLRAEALLLVKSAPVSNGCDDLVGIAARGLLDSHFPALAAHYDDEIRLLGPADAGRLRAGLRAGIPPGVQVRQREAPAAR